MANIETLTADTRYWLEVAAPGTPAAGTVVTYAKSDGKMYSKDDAGSETLMSAGSAGIPVTIFDAANDIIYATAADTAARLALGAAGGALSRVNGALAYNSGTSFPTATTGDRYLRTDLTCREWFYDGTRWLSEQIFELPLGPWNTTLGTGTIATQSGSYRLGVPPLLGGSDIYLLNDTVNFYVNGGTALSGSHSWVGTFAKADSAGTETTISTHTINSGASSAFRVDTQTINALLGTTSFIFTTNWTKTGTPGNLIHWHQFTYRLVAV